MKQFWVTATQRTIVMYALKVSLFVGTILNLINQGQPLLNGAAINWGQVILNYLVPYSVASYSAAKNELLRSD